MSKKIIRNIDPNGKKGMTIEFFGTLDSSLFLTYAIFQFLNGSIGDRFDKKRVLITSYTI
jgi:sugar phosphate permease